MESDGWNYTGNPQEGQDCRCLVTLEESGMTWVGIRAWNGNCWLSTSEPGPERARVHAWMALPQPAKGFWVHGKLHFGS